MTDQQLVVETEQGAVHGDLRIPPLARGVVVFAHGSGSSRHSPRNKKVAQRLEEWGLGTLLIDLLTEREETVDAATAEHRFDISLLAERLVLAVERLNGEPDAAGLRTGFFGASTGAAAALVAAARITEVAAVVSRGGRPDLAAEALDAVTAPTLLIVGGRDDVVLELNGTAFDRLTCEKDLRIVEGAGHLFEEPGALDEVADLARDWFLRHLPDD